MCHMITAMLLRGNTLLLHKSSVCCHNIQAAKPQEMVESNRAVIKSCAFTEPFLVQRLSCGIGAVCMWCSPVRYPWEAELPAGPRHQGAGGATAQPPSALASPPPDPQHHPTAPLAPESTINREFVSLVHVSYSIVSAPHQTQADRRAGSSNPRRQQPARIGQQSHFPAEASQKGR